jgi:hypothetical protein
VECNRSLNAVHTTPPTSFLNVHSCLLCRTRRDRLPTVLPPSSALPQQRLPLHLCLHLCRVQPFI